MMSAADITSNQGAQMDTPTTPLAEITGEAPTTGQLANGQAASGYNITFKTRNGITGVFFVPNAQFTKDYVLAQLSKEANKLEAVFGSTVDA